VISRAARQAEYPARFQLVAAFVSNATGRENRRVAENRIIATHAAPGARGLGVRTVDT